MRSNRRSGALCLVLFLFAALSQAQPSFDTNSVAPQRFIAVHGRKALVMGYASRGLELWAYPLQLISGYELGFRAAGETTELNASALLRRVIYEPEAITRIYLGPDFVVRERLFVPLNDAAVFLTYSVEGRRSIDIVIHFTPVLDLMWPASIGGQNTHWDSAVSAFLLADGLGKYSAMIGSAEVVSHDRTANSTQPGNAGRRLGFAVRASSGHSATVVVSSSGESSSPSRRMNQLLAAQPAMEVEAHDHYAQLLASTLHIETPDDAVNRQLAWAQIALDQAWVCNPVLGCGLVAGYGPSRDARRPQYAWFFAGDGLIAVDAMVNTGDDQQAQQALAFIAKYQNPSTGMLWHELSQSADPADWAAKYPYMFVHVDITFHYLATVEHYVTASGDTKFLQQNWPGIEAAYRYCKSLLDSADGLPRIPAGKEGGNEQDRMSDDLSLAASWVRASASFARLASLNGHAPMAEEAMQLSEKAKRSAASRYWGKQQDSSQSSQQNSPQNSSWIDGYDGAGHAVLRHSVHGVDLVTAHILDPQQMNSALNQLSSSAFQTDWGTRGVDANSARFDPASYASGSVSPVSTGAVASALWSEHRPYTAYPVWRSLIPWGTLDSMGHMHEVLAGNFYHPQEESVPEQTWSSASFLSSAVQGLVGLVRDADGNRLEFSPHLPASWDKISVEHIRVSGGAVDLSLSRGPGGWSLEANNSGRPVQFLFSPQIPFGARLRGADLDGKPLNAQREEHPQDTHATVRFTLPAGKIHCVIRYTGGISVSITSPSPLVGDPSKAAKITSVTYRAATLVIGLDVSRDPESSPIELRTEEKPMRAQGAQLKPVSQGVYVIQPDPAPAPASGYRHIEIVIDFRR